MTATVKAIKNFAKFNMPFAIKKEFNSKEAKTRSHLIDISNESSPRSATSKLAPGSTYQVKF